jgi:K+-sensing histidine kinase KdpD
MMKPGHELPEGIAQAQKSLPPCSRLVSHLVHEITQPLTVMEGLLEHALVFRRSPAQYESLLETVRREVDRLSHMVRRVRDMAEIDSVVEPELAVPLVQAVKRTVEQMAPGVEPKEPQIEIHAPREIFVWAGRRRLEWGLEELISGALRRSPKRGKVLISISSSSLTATLRISDRGPDAVNRSSNGGAVPLPGCFATPRPDRDGLEWVLAQWMFVSSGANLVVRNRARRGCVVTVTLPVAEDK